MGSDFELVSKETGGGGGFPACAGLGEGGREAEKGRRRVEKSKKQKNKVVFFYLSLSFHTHKLF